MRKKGGDFFGFLLEKKVERIVLDLFQNSNEAVTVKQIIAELDADHDFNLYRRVRNCLYNLNTEGVIEIIKEPGQFKIPTIYVKPCQYSK